MGRLPEPCWEGLHGADMPSSSLIVWCGSLPSAMVGSGEGLRREDRTTASASRDRQPGRRSTSSPTKFPPQQNGTNPFVFHVDRGKLTDPANEAATRRDRTRRSRRRPHVYSVTNPVTKDAAGRRDSCPKDGRTGFMPVLLDGQLRVHHRTPRQKVLEATDAGEEGRDPGGGRADRSGACSRRPTRSRARCSGNIAAMVILALVFGSLVAMGTPIVTAVFALVGRDRR